MLNRIKKYRNELCDSSTRRVWTIVVHLGLFIFLSGTFQNSYGEIEQRMSGYPLLLSVEQVPEEQSAPTSDSAPRVQPVSSVAAKPSFSVSNADGRPYNARTNSSDSDQSARLPAGKSPQEKQPFSSLSSEESVYLAVYLNKRMLTEVIEGKEKNGLVYFKLQDMAILLEAMPPQDKTAIATAQALEKIFPAKFNYSRNLQALLIEGNGKLSVEQRWERERRQKMLAHSMITDDTPIVNFDYGLIGPPSFDLSASYLSNGQESFNYSFKGGMEALYGTANIFGRGFDDDELTDLRVSWERFHQDWFVKLGDVISPPIELVAQSDAGRGINFSTFPIENSTQFDTDTITGDLLDGWEVELYRGNTLLGFRKSDGSGRFIFRDIPLLFGENNITLKFYGPQGQVRQESRSVNIGQGMAPEGKLWTRFSLIDQGENLFLGRNSQTRNHIEGFRGFGEVFYGLTNRLTLTGSVTSFKSDSLERRTVAKAGFLTSQLGSSLKMDFLADDNDGYGIQSSLLSRLGDWGIQYNHVEFFDLKTDLEPNLKRRRTLRLNRGFENIFLELSAEHRVDTFDVDRYEYQAKVSGSAGPVLLTHDTEANFGGGNEFVRGTLLTNGRITPNTLLRTSLNYEVHPETEVRSIQGTLDYRASKAVTLRLNATKNMIDERDFVISQSLLWEGEKVGTGITGSYSTDGHFQIMASVTFSLSPDSTGSYQMNRSPSTNVGTVNVRVFLDHDQDGQYNSEVDEVLENVRLKNQSDVSGKNGMIALKGPAYRLAHVRIDENSLPDPFMVTSPPVAVRPRPTHINTMNVPVWETGEIEGQAEPGELVELVDNGKVIASTHAEFDGFFLFEKVRFKKYGVRTQHQHQIVEVSREHPIARVKWNKAYQLAKS